MKIINQEELNKILDLHKKWLDDKPDGERAKLSYTDLRGLDLKCAYLGNAYLTNAYLTNANLRGAYLRGANLRNANLKCADLYGANLRNADLIYADLSCVNLSCANLRGADLRGAYLTNANLSNANLSNIIYNSITAFFAMQCPEEGSFIGFKKANGKIVKLLITEDSLRSSATSRKCRCSKAKVLSITSLDGEESFDKIASKYDESFIYEVGKIVEVKDFDKNRWNECSTGIHFFITREEAINY